MSLCISAIVPTHNRAAYLRKVLQSLSSQTLPPAKYEILVVDNGSRDDTRRVVLEEFGWVPNLRYLYEPVLGLGQARNTGWQNSTAEFVAFTDDDAIVASDWLEKILWAFNHVQPLPGCIGGPVQPIWEAPRPEWLSDDLLPLITVIKTEPAHILTTGEWLAGANISFPKRVLEELGGFQVGLGRVGSKLLSNDEILLERMLDAKGYARYFDPQIVVQHHIPAARLTQAWFIRRGYWQGVSEIAIGPDKNLAGRERLRLGLYRLKQMLTRYYFLRLFKPTTRPVEFTEKVLAYARLGAVFAVLGLAR